MDEWRYDDTDNHIIHTSIATGWDMELEDNADDDDPVMNVLRTTIMGQKQWIPRLQNVIEDNQSDLDIENKTKVEYTTASCVERNHKVDRGNSRAKKIKSTE